MRLIDAVELSTMLGYGNTEPEKVVDEKTGRIIKRKYPAGLQRCWELARCPEEFGLDPAAIVRIGSSIRYRVDLIEEWWARGGTRQKPRKVTATNGGNQRSAAA